MSWPRRTASLATMLGTEDRWQAAACAMAPGARPCSGVYRESEGERAGRRRHHGARGSRSGEAEAATPGQAHELALKAAETDATKRALSVLPSSSGPNRTSVARTAS